MKEQNSKNTIMQCALELFSQKGYRAVGLNEIMENAGVSKPTLYHFFGSKDGLFDELLRVHYAVLDERLRAVCVYHPRPDRYEEDVFPQLLRVVTTYFRYAKEYTSFYLMVLSLSFAPPSSETALLSAPYHGKQYRLVKEMFRQIGAVHRNVAGDEGLYAMRLVALINAQIGFWYRGHSRLERTEAESLVKQYMHGIFA